MTDQRYSNSTFQVEYPYNKSTITRSGHEIDINDTPGHESLRFMHTRGTGVEINETGGWSQVVADNATNYFKKGLTETVEGHKDVKIAGNLNSNVDNSINDVTGGDRNMAQGGSLIIATGGTRLDHVSDDMTVTIDGTHTVAIAGDASYSTTGDHVSLVNGTKKEILSEVQTTATGNIEIINTGNVYRIKTGTFIVEADAIILKTSTGGQISLGALISLLSPGAVSITAGLRASITAADVSITGPAGINLNNIL